MKDEQQYASIAAIRTFYDKGLDLLDAISDIVLAVVEDEFKTEDIKSQYKSVYLSEIPESVLKMVLKRLKRKELIFWPKTNSAIRLTKLGLSAKSKSEDAARAAKRDFKDFIIGYKEFCEKQKIHINNNFEEGIIDFIDSNLGLTSSIIAGDSNQLNKRASSVARYIMFVEENNPQRFKTLQQIFFGRLYLDLIKKPRNNYSKETKLDKLTILYDTNILFNIIGLHGKNLQQQSKDLFKEIQSIGNIRQSILSTTIAEAQLVIKMYDNKEGDYLDDFKTDSIYQRLQTLGIDKYKIILLRENLRNKSTELGIKNIQITPAEKEKAERDNILQDKIKRATYLVEKEKTTGAVLHDTILVRYTQYLRGNANTSLIEKSKAIIISDDISLKELSKQMVRDVGGSHLVLKPAELISYLWIMGISDERTVNNIVKQSIMSYTREKLINHDLWDKFIEELKKARKEDVLSDQDISLILASQHTGDLLARNRKDAIKNIISKENINTLKKDATDAKMFRAARSKMQSIAEKISNVIIILLTIIVSILLLTIVHYLLLRSLDWGTTIDWIIRVSTVVFFVITLGLGKPLTIKPLFQLRTWGKNKITARLIKIINKITGIKPES